MFSRRNDPHRSNCQSWKDLTTAEIAKYSSNKTRAVCQLTKEHHGQHEDQILGLAWAPGGWPRNHVYPIVSTT